LKTGAGSRIRRRGATSIAVSEALPQLEVAPKTLASHLEALLLLNHHVIPGLSGIALRFGVTDRSNLCGVFHNPLREKKPTAKSGSFPGVRMVTETVVSPSRISSGSSTATRSCFEAVPLRSTVTTEVIRVSRFN
jgi:hypothetical protein